MDTVCLLGYLVVRHFYLTCLVQSYTQDHMHTSTEESLLLLSSLEECHNLSKSKLPDILSSIISIHVPQKPQPLQSRHVFQMHWPAMLRSQLNCWFIIFVLIVNVSFLPFPKLQTHNCSTPGCTYDGRLPTTQFMELPIEYQLQELFRGTLLSVTTEPHSILVLYQLDDPNFHASLRKNLRNRSFQGIGLLTDSYDGKIYKTSLP